MDHNQRTRKTDTQYTTTHAASHHTNKMKNRTRKTTHEENRKYDEMEQAYGYENEQSTTDDHDGDSDPTFASDSEGKSRQRRMENVVVRMPRPAAPQKSIHWV